MTKSELQSSKTSQLLYAFWIFTLIVIAWGAWVRISHSGNGCGDHWPLCQGNFIPDLQARKTIIEFSHRLMSGLYGLLVIYIFIYFKKNNFSKNTKNLSFALLFFMILEALLGALLVKQNLVTVNDSIFRLIAMCLHQLNSFLLTGTTYLLYLSVKNNFEINLNIKKNKLNILFLILAVSGAIASLAATLFPSLSLLDGIIKDFSSDSHLFIKLRILHPVFALVSISGVIYWLQTRTENHVLAFKLFVALFVGVITLVTLSPIWLKITHLMIAHFIWSELLKYQLLRKHQSI